LDYLRQMTKLRQLNLDDTSVTAAGLARLQGLERLEELRVGPNIPLPAAAELKTHFPMCRIRGTAPGGKLAFILNADGKITDYSNDDPQQQPAESVERQ